MQERVLSKFSGTVHVLEVKTRSEDRNKPLRAKTETSL